MPIKSLYALHGVDDIGDDYIVAGSVCEKTLLTPVHGTSIGRHQTTWEDGVIRLHAKRNKKKRANSWTGSERACADERCRRRWTKLRHRAALDHCHDGQTTGELSGSAHDSSPLATENPSPTCNFQRVRAPRRGIRTRSAFPTTSWHFSAKTSPNLTPPFNNRRLTLCNSDWSSQIAGMSEAPIGSEEYQKRTPNLPSVSHVVLRVV